MVICVLTVGDPLECLFYILEYLNATSAILREKMFIEETSIYLNGF